MRELFKSSRRRLGVLTLVMALFVSGWWVRSIGREDILHVCLGRSMIIIVSRDESLIFSRKRYLTQAIALSKSLAIFRSVLKPLNMGVMSHMSTSESAIEYWLGDSSPFSNADSNWQKMLGPVVIGGDSHSTLSDQHESWFLITPYWMIAVPLALALMSGYLILSGFRTHPRTTQLNASLQSAAGRRPE